MGTIYRRTSPQLGSISTSKYLTIATSPATQVSLDSGSRSLTIFNHGTGSIIWGDSNIQVNSGNYLFVNVRTEWSDLQDGWSVYLRADSVASIVSVTQYGI